MVRRIPPQLAWPSLCWMIQGMGHADNSGQRVLRWQRPVGSPTSLAGRACGARRFGCCRKASWCRGACAPAVPGSATMRSYQKQTVAIEGRLPQSQSIDRRRLAGPCSSVLMRGSLVAARSITTQASGFGPSGRVKITLVPSPGMPVLSVQMRPPCSSTICLAMARPRPLPPLARLRAGSSR